jgi:hypothetical protein
MKDLSCQLTIGDGDDERAGPDQNTAIATYVLTFVLALLALFPDFFAKGGDVVPEAPDGESSYIRLNDATPNPRSSSTSPSPTLQLRW